MLIYTISSNNKICIEHLVLDFNGTIAIDGKLIEGVLEHLKKISQQLTLHLITANTFNSVSEYQHILPASIHILQGNNTTQAKFDFIQKLNPKAVIAIGNGNNDYLMLQHAAVGIAIIQQEGAAFKAIQHADMVCCNIIDALQIVLNPNRLVATLRQ